MVRYAQLNSIEEAVEKIHEINTTATWQDNITNQYCHVEDLVEAEAGVLIPVIRGYEHYFTGLTIIEK